MLPAHGDDPECAEEAAIEDEIRNAVQHRARLTRKTTRAAGHIRHPSPVGHTNRKRGTAPPKTNG